MANVRITWNLPPVGRSQRPLKYVKVEISGDAGANYSALANVAASAEQRSDISDIEPGDYRVRLTVVDIADGEGAPVVTPFSVAFAAPGVVTNVQVAVE